MVDSCIAPTNERSSGSPEFGLSRPWMSTMWAPHPKGRVIRRPQPDFSHLQARLLRRPPRAREPVIPEPDPHRNYKYFGIHRSDVTEYLKHVVPSHAFHPSLVGAPPPPRRGRCPRPQRRPETAPAASDWFGRTSSDVSDWLRCRPPAHLGLDPDDRPLPHYPTTSSLVTDSKWQAREYPPLPNVLWHWWADRPSSVPLATNPQEVRFDTLVDACRRTRVARPPSSRGIPTPNSTPRSGAQTPRGDDGPDEGVRTPGGGHTPRGGGESGRSESSKAAAGSGESPRQATPRPQSAPTPVQPQQLPTQGGHTGSLPPRPKLNLGGVGASPRPPSTPRPQSAASASSYASPRPLGPCACATPTRTPRSGCSASPVGASSAVASPRVGRMELGHENYTPIPKCKCQGPPPLRAASPREGPLRAIATPGASPRGPSAEPPLIEALKCSCRRPSSAGMASPRGGEVLTPRMGPSSDRAPSPWAGNTSTRASPPSGTSTPTSTVSGPSNVDMSKSVSPLQLKGLGQKVAAPSTAATPGCRSPQSPQLVHPDPPSPQLVHPYPPHVPRQPVTKPPCERHPASLYVQGRGSSIASAHQSKPAGKIDRPGNDPTMEDLQRISPDTFATKCVWREKFKKEGKGMQQRIPHAWTSDETNTSATVKAY